jgi:protein-S-isoprenylcysteine O-methyltransferase Ste14
MMAETNKEYSFAKLVCMSFLILLFFPTIIILLSGNPLWVEGWMLSFWFDAMMLVNIIYMYKKNPALISERLNTHGSHNQEKWDKYVLALLFLISAFWICGMPLDAQRFGWSPRFPLIINSIGCIFLIPAFYLLIRATIENPYLSTVVRMQSDRQQKVISTGVYGKIRHPQYLGIVLTIIGGPLLLGSIIGLILGLCIAIIILGRIKGEEKMLVKELEGYEEYRQRVKYRLLPLIW